MTPHPEERTPELLLRLYNLAFYVRHHRGHREQVDAAINKIVKEDTDYECRGLRDRAYDEWKEAFT